MNKNKKQLPSYLETVEDQQAKDHARRSKSFETGEMVKVYMISGVQRMKVNEVYDTPVEHVKLYELKSPDGSYYYATKVFMAKI